MKTYKGWMKSGKNFEKYIEVNDEVDAELYWYFMETMQPRMDGATWFLMGEPITQDEHGVLMYDLYMQIGGKYYYKGYHTTFEVFSFIEKTRLWVHL